MRKISLLSLAILLASAASAQISKGSTFIGGQLGAFKSKSESTGSISSSQENKGFEISPAFGKAIKENLIFGIDLSYGSAKYSPGAGPVNESSSVGGGVFARKYFSLAKRFYFFGQVRTGYNHSETEQGNAPSKVITETNNINLGLYPGVSYALSTKFYIEAGFNNLALLGYSTGKQEQTSQLGPPNITKYKSFGFSTSLSTTDFTFAVRFILPNK